MEEIGNPELQPLSKEQRTDFWTRFAAYLLDGLFVIIVGVIIGLLIGDLITPLFFGSQIEEINNNLAAMPNNSDLDFTTFMNYTFGIAAGAMIANFIILVMEAVRGQSIGKMLVRIRITDEYGNQAKPKALWIRSSLKYGSTILSLISGVTGIVEINTLGTIESLVIFVGFFFALMDSRQTLHDMAAKTVVTSVKR